MARITFLFSLLLVIIGCIGFMGTGFEHKTALIPAYWGIALALTGLLALKEKWRMHAMHVAVLIGLIGALASGGMAIKKLISGTAAITQMSILMQLSMSVVCALFVALCINSFIQVRRNRKADSSNDDPA